MTFAECLSFTFHAATMYANMTNDLQDEVIWLPNHTAP